MLVSIPELLLQGQLFFRLSVFAHDADQKLFQDPVFLFEVFSGKQVGLPTQSFLFN